MNDTQAGPFAERWSRALRDAGRDRVAETLDGWIAADAGELPDTVSALRAQLPFGPLGGAFARLGARMRGDGLGTGDLEAALHAFGDALRGAPCGADGRAEDAATGSVTSGVRGLIAGGWHGDPAASGAASSGDGSPAALDPALGRILRHDIKTPLQAASLNLELLAMEHEADASVTDAIATIMQSLDSAVEMLQRFDPV